MRDGILAPPTEHASGTLIAFVALAGRWHIAKLAFRPVESALPDAPGIDRNFRPLRLRATRDGLIVYVPVAALSLMKKSRRIGLRRIWVT